MPPFLVEIAIEPKLRSRGNLEEFEVALNRLAAEDEHGFIIQTDRETGQTVVKGLSEEHLAWLVERMGSKCGVALAFEIADSALVVRARPGTKRGSLNASAA